MLMVSINYGNCQYSVVRHNPLSSLSSKLRTFSISAVLNETLSLQCPHNSKVWEYCLQFEGPIKHF